MDPTKQVGEARNPNGSLKEAHKIEWFNDPDDPFPISNRKSAEVFFPVEHSHLD